MLLNWKKRGHVLYASLEGELDQHSASDLRDKLNLLIEDKAVTRIEFELSGVTFMDSSGIGLVMGRYKNIADYGGKMVITGLSPQAYKVMKLSGIERIAEIYIKREEKKK